MSLIDIILCCAFSLTLPIGQVLFKRAALRHGETSGPLAIRVLTNRDLVIACAWYCGTALFWFLILTRIPLVAAYPFAIAGSASVPLVSSVVFKEKLSRDFAVGFGLMLLGLTLVVAPPIMR